MSFPSSRLGLAGRVAARGFSRTGLRSRTGGLRTGQGVTTQRDSRLIYRKKSMPFRRKRRWKRFVKKIHAVSEKELGSRTVVFNSLVTTTNNVSGDQGYNDYAIYGQSSTNGWLNDLAQIATVENTGNPTQAAGATIWTTTKIMFQSAILDLTIRNASTFNDGTSTLPNGAAKLELDVYEITVSKDGRDSTGNYNRLSSILEEGFTRALTTGGAGNQLLLQRRGVTPFDSVHALSRFGIKIWRKTKYFIPNGDTITYQMRDPKRRVSTLQELAVEEGYNRPKWTRSLLVIFKLVPGLTVGTTANTYQEVINVGVTRKYLYKVEGLNDDRDRYL